MVDQHEHPVKAEFRIFSNECSIQKSHSEIIHQFALDTENSFGVAGNALENDIFQKTGIKIQVGFAGNISRNTVALRHLKLFVFYLYRFHPNFYEKGKIDENGRKIVLWQLIPNLPRPEEQIEYKEKIPAARSFLKIRTTENNSYSRNTYSFSMWHGQPSSVGGRLSVYVSASFGTAVTSGYSYSFKSARLATDILADRECFLEISQAWHSSSCFASPNADVSFRPDGACGFLDFRASDGVLFGTYRLNDLPYFSISPKKTPYQFNAELLVQAIDLNIEPTQAQLDLGETKQSIIRVLLSEALEENKREDNWIVVARQKLEIFETEDVY